MIGKNNPLNVRYVNKNKWRGQIGHTKGFIDFCSKEYCIRTVCYLIMQSYRKAGVYSISGIIHRYAPESENPTDDYVAYVCKFCHFVPSSVPGSRNDVALIVAAMCNFEQGVSDRFKRPSDYVDSFEVLEVIKKFNLKFYYK